MTDPIVSEEMQFLRAGVAVKDPRIKFAIGYARDAWVQMRWVMTRGEPAPCRQTARFSAGEARIPLLREIE